MLSAIPSYNPYQPYRVIHLTLPYAFLSYRFHTPADTSSSGSSSAIVIAQLRYVRFRDPDYLGQFRPRFYLQFIAPRRIFIRATYEINTSATLTVPPRERGSKYHLRRRILISSIANVCVISACALSRSARESTGALLVVRARGWKSARNKRRRIVRAPFLRPAVAAGRSRGAERNKNSLHPAGLSPPSN